MKTLKSFRNYSGAGAVANGVFSTLAGVSCAASMAGGTWGFAALFGGFMALGIWNKEYHVLIRERSHAGEAMENLESRPIQQASD